jgi:hypothetical protein
MFMAGDQVTVAGRVHRRDATLMWVDNMMLGDGREVLIDGGSKPRWSVAPAGTAINKAPVNAQAENKGIFRVWSVQSISHAQQLPFRATSPREDRPELIERLDAYAARCEPMGMPGVMGTPHPVEFIDRGSVIQLVSLSNNARTERVIELSETPSDAAQPATRMGHTLARWESPTRLVARTTRIDWPYFSDERGIEQSDSVETIETFTLSDDQTRLQYEMTVIDPVLFSAPAVTFTVNWVALGEKRSEPADCLTRD